MATIAATVDRNTVPGAVLVTWTGLTTGDVGGGIPIAYAADLSLQQFGTIGGATTTWQGSNDGATWHPMTQRGSTADMSYTTASLHLAQENPAFIRPIVTGGTGVSITCVAAVHARYAKAPY